MRRNIAQMSRTAPLPYLLISVTEMSYKRSLLVIWKISRPFINTLSADGKYSLLKRDNLRHPIQMQLSRKGKTSSKSFWAFLKSSLNFVHFQTKDCSHS